MPGQHLAPPGPQDPAHRHPAPVRGGGREVGLPQRGLPAHHQLHGGVARGPAPHILVLQPPAAASGARLEGHLRPGARAELELGEAGEGQPGPVRSVRVSAQQLPGGRGQHDGAGR